MQEIIQYEYYETKEDLLALLLKTPILDDFSEIESVNNTHNPSIEKDLFDTYVLNILLQKVLNKTCFIWYCC